MARGWTQTAAVESGARNTRHVCKVRGLGPATTEVCKLPSFLHGIRIRRVSGISMAFRSVLSKIRAELGGQFRVPWWPRGEAALDEGTSPLPPFCPTGMKLERLDYFSWGPSPSPSSLLPCLWEIFTKIFGSCKFCNNWKFQKKIRCL